MSLGKTMSRYQSIRMLVATLANANVSLPCTPGSSGQFEQFYGTLGNFSGSVHATIQVCWAHTDDAFIVAIHARIRGGAGGHWTWTRHQCPHVIKAAQVSTPRTCILRIIITTINQSGGSLLISRSARIILTPIKPVWRALLESISKLPKAEFDRRYRALHRHVKLTYLTNGSLARGRGVCCAYLMPIYVEAIVTLTCCCQGLWPRPSDIAVPLMVW